MCDGVRALYENSRKAHVYPKESGCFAGKFLESAEVSRTAQMLHQLVTAVCEQEIRT